MQIHLEGELTIHRISEQHAALLTATATPDGEVALLDLSGVTEIDSAGVQLLLSLRRHLSQIGSTMELTGSHGDVKQALETYQLDPTSLDHRDDAIHLIRECSDE